MVLVLFEAYSGWASHKNIESADKSNTYPYDFFEGERNFYFECWQTVVGKFGDGHYLKVSRVLKTSSCFLFIYLMLSTWK